MDGPFESESQKQNRLKNDGSFTEEYEKNKLNQVVIKDQVVPVSPREYFELFLQDDAEHSLVKCVSSIF
jgi:hypothetical protein